jgi:hypothetical protein
MDQAHIYRAARKLTGAGTARPGSRGYLNKTSEWTIIKAWH